MTCLGLHNWKVTNPTLDSSLLTPYPVLFLFSSSHVDRGAGDRTGRRKRERAVGEGERGGNFQKRGKENQEGLRMK